jgi:CRISPR-associated protein Csx1
MKVLIATWGNPCVWDIVDYEYEGQSTTASTSLELIQQVENPNHTIVIISDTLADLSFLPKSNKNHCNCYNSQPFKDYNDVKDRAKNCAMSVISQHRIKINKITVSPGVGYYSYSSFIGSSRDFYHITLYEIVDYIVQSVLNSKFKEMEIIFDITHGQNYQIIFSYEVVYEIAQILSYFYKVNIKVLYSEPVIPTSNNKKYRINQIANFQVFPKLPVYIDHNLLNNLKQKIDQNQKDNLVNYYCFASSIIHGLPYFIYYFMPDLNNLQTDLQNELKSFYSNIFINQNKSVERKISISENFSDLVKIYLISYILDKKEYKNQSNLSIDKLENLSKFLYMRISILRDRIKLEIKRFSKPKQRKQTILPSDDKRFQRNFFAHHGLLDFIFIRGSGITFKSDVYQNKIQHFLLNEVPRR